MTGIQDSLVVGDQLIDLVAGLGVDPDHIHVLDPLPRNHAANVALLKKEIEHPGLSVIVPRRACIHVGRKKKKVAEAIKAATEAQA
jgi:indolepyruvate ferredoxin oxidoreductase alpha subunit